MAELQQQSDPDLRGWQLQLEEARRTAPSDLKAAADKWAGTISLLAGAVGSISVIFAPKALADFSNDKLRLAAIILLALAALLGLIAVALATFVAQGWPKIEASLDAAAYKQQTLNKMASGVLVLQSSRWLTFPTVLCVIAASTLAVTDTLAAPAKGVHVLVVNRDGTTKCQSLADVTKGSSVLSVTVVGSC